MSSPSSPVSQDELDTQTPVTPPKKRRWRTIVLVGIGLLIATTLWQVLSLQQSSRPAGRPLAYSKTHLHTVVMSKQAGVMYLGTHYGLFTSTDGGQTWPQSQGALDANMVTSIAVNPLNPNLLAALAIPTSVDQKAGVYMSADGGASWRFTLPSPLPSAAYPYTLQSGPDRFYLFLTYAGWYETRDLGLHWQAITDKSMTEMQTSSLLVDPERPDHLIMGGNLGLYETQDDGQSWQHLSSVQGSVVALTSTQPSPGNGPRQIFCATDQGLYRWQDGQSPIERLNTLPVSTPPTRLLLNDDGSELYGLFGSDLWFSADQGESWTSLWHFSRGDLVSLVLNPDNPRELLAGFYSPGAVLKSSDGGRSWSILTN